MFLFNLHVVVLQNPMILGQNSTASHEFELTEKQQGNQMYCAILGMGFSIFTPAANTLENFISVYTWKKPQVTRGYSFPT